MSQRRGIRVLLVLMPFILLQLSDYAFANIDNQHYMPPLECYDPYGRPQRCIPEFENAAFDTVMQATNTCGDEDEVEFCQQTGYSHKKSCEICRKDDHSPIYLTDLHDPHRPTWWQSETMFEGIQYPNHVNLTLNLGKSYDITYIRIVFYSPRPESFSIYKRLTPNGPWIPYQHYSATCRQTYKLPDSHLSVVVKKGEDEARALCTSEYSDISPLRDGNIAFSTLESRPSAIEFENSLELQNWVTATDIKISLDRLNTFGDEVFGDTQVLRSYFYAIADIAVGARCKCNGHASNCILSTGLNGQRSRVCECKHNTDGPDCDRCLPFYNDQPWGRATSKNVNECKACNCNGYSTKCFFDQHLYNLTGHGGHCMDCAANRDGPNCERCKDNYYLVADGHCDHCNCNPTGSRSLQCNGEGKCQCKPGVTGEKCDRCDANFYNFGNHGCSPCHCDPAGSLDNTPSCNPETGVCVCKDNVEGTHCRDCKPGFFNLDLDNRFGCTPCFCYGHTSECSSANAYGSVSVLSGFHKHIERWTAIDVQSPWVKPELKFNKYSQSVGVGSHGSEYVYFVASDRFLGDQRASYNRLLKFRLQLIGQSGPNPSPSDVILEGAGTSISLPIFAQGHPIPDQQSREYAFRLHEHPDYSWQPSQTARGLMSILSNLTAIKIRASYAQVGEAYLDDVELQTAQRGAAGPTAHWVEQCSCPEGYIGQFCESCAPGFRHSPANGGSFMPCVPCDCHKHADICDSETGRCICQHNTAGDTCDQCARGYYGNALAGTPYDCKRCPCPDNGACMTMADDSVICLECPVGYFGQRCESCADGFYGDPTGINGRVQLCQTCDCNGNIDPNAVGNCNRTTGDCMKCIYNTAGAHCDQCLPGYFGDPLAIPHGHCDQCSCFAAGTEQTDDGISICEPVTGACRCKPNVKGRDCNECQNGFFNIHSGNGCESCNCDPLGSYNSSCSYDGQCFCKPGVTGKRCDQCAQYQYGFSAEGCKPCDCDESGSQGFQCDEFGQCPCNANVEGQRCDRCKENKYDRHHGCLDCAPCYNLVQDAANDHRAKLKNMKKLLQDIASTPTVINDDQFEAKIKAVQEKFDILYEDAKSGAGGGGDQTVLERVEDLQERLENVAKILGKSEESDAAAHRELEKANRQVSLSNATILEARKYLHDALDRLQTEGVNALALAKDRSDQFGSQSDQISEISREARAQADALEKKAKENREIAEQANNKAEDAFKMAKEAYRSLQDVNHELTSDIYEEMEATASDLKKTVRKVDDAQRRADEQYDEALSLLATVNSLSPPEVNIEQIKTQTKKNNEEANKIEDTMKNMKDAHAKLLEEVVINTDHSVQLLGKADKQRDDAVKLLEEAKISNAIAKEAVAQGDGTLKEANATYHILAGFQNKVSESSVSAEAAMKIVPEIEAEIANSEEMIRDAERAIRAASSNANQAKLNAETAQEKYAETASKDAEEIRKDANNTKEEARKLASEADQLAGRVAATENKIAKLEAAARKDDELTEQAKQTVNQAQTNSLEASKQVQSAMNAVKEIIEELNNLRDISEEDLNELDRRLSEAEQNLNVANLSMRMENLNEYKNYHNSLLKQHQTTILHLEQEVITIKAIADALPEDCFKRTRLEPI